MQADDAHCIPSENRGFSSGRLNQMLCGQIADAKQHHPHGTGGRLDGLCDALHGSVFLIAQRQHLPRFFREFIEAFLKRVVACRTIWLPLDECLSKLMHQRVKKYQTLPTLFAIMIRNARLGKPKRPRDERPRAIVFV
jgi:hypothetical protein